MGFVIDREPPPSNIRPAGGDFRAGDVLLAALTGADPALAIEAGVLAIPLPANGPREHWMRAARRIDGEGRVTVTPFPDQDSSLIGVFSRADCLVMRAAGAPAAAKGEVVQVLPLARG